MKGELVTIVAIILVCSLLFILGGVAGYRDLQNMVRKEMIEKGIGSWVVDSKTGVTHFNSQIDALK